MFKVVYIIAFLFAVVTSASKPRIPLGPEVSNELGSLIESSNLLHKYLVERKDIQVKAQILKLNSQVQKVMEIAKSDDQKASHLNRILGAIQKELSLAQNVTGEDRTRFIQNAYRQLVTLYQSYQINKKYGVFFCKTDRSVWIQEGTKPKNPFQPESHCGKKVN